MTKHLLPDAALARSMGISAEQWHQLTPEARVEVVKCSGLAPSGVGDEIVRIAPARGPVERFTPREVIRTEAGNFRTVRTGHCGRDALRRGDPFDVMEHNAAKGAKTRSGEGRALFTTAQVMAGRSYGALAERHAARGVRCSSLEQSHRGSSGGAYIDAQLAERERLNRMRAAIGDTWAISPRRVFPHSDERRAIKVRAVVDLVCIEGRTLSDVLRRFGWKVNGRHRDDLRAPLCEALDRLHGL